MSITKTFVGFTDSGQPLVLGEGCCEHFLPSKNRLIHEESCWYCQFSDFRKTTDTVLTQSICRCPQNTVCILKDAENEQGTEGGTHHV